MCPLKPECSCIYVFYNLTELLITSYSFEYIHVNSLSSSKRKFLPQTYGLYGAHFFRKSFFQKVYTLVIRMNPLINFAFENKIMVSPFFSRDLTNPSIAPDCYSDSLSQKRVKNE